MQPYMNGSASWSTGLPGAPRNFFRASTQEAANKSLLLSPHCTVRVPIAACYFRKPYFSLWVGRMHQSLRLGGAVKGMIPQMEPWFGEEEATAVCEYMRSGGWLTEFDQDARIRIHDRRLHRRFPLHRHQQRDRQPHTGRARLRRTGGRRRHRSELHDDRVSQFRIDDSAPIRFLWTWNRKRFASTSTKPNRR